LFKTGFHPPKRQESLAANIFHVGSVTMDSGLESAGNQHRVSLGGGYCNITTLFSHRRGQYDFDIKIHGYFVPPASHIMSSAPIEQPGQDVGGFATSGLDEDSHFGGIGRLGAIFSNGVRRAGQELDIPVAASNQTNGHIEDIEPVQDAALDAQFELDFDFPSQAETAPLHIPLECQDGLYDMAFNDHLLNNVPQEPTTDILTTDIPGQKTDFSGRIETNPSAASACTEMNISSKQFDEGVPSDVFDMDIPGQESYFSGSLGPNSNLPSASPMTSFSSNDFNLDTPNDIFSIDCPRQEINFSNSFETNPNAPSASQETSSSNDFNLTPIPSTPPHSSQAATPSSSNSSPDRHSCRHCNSTFKRQTDLKRHAKVHFPGQRKFHCRQPGCVRNGRKGFYRRDKLRDHEKQVHEF
jgi:hypothetical protein